MKRITCILLALTLVLALSVAVFADNNNTITVKSAKAGETYNVYKLLDLSADLNQGTDGAFRYTLNSTWSDFFTTGAGAAYVDISADGQNVVTWKAAKNTAADLEAFAKAAEAYAETNNIAVTDTATPTTDGDLDFTNLDYGYYLITSTLGTLAMTETNPGKTAVEINEKNPGNTITKYVVEDNTGIPGSANDAQIGDTVNFKTELTLNHGTTNVVVHDTMDDGLTLNTTSIVVAVRNGSALTPTTDYVIDLNPTGETFTVTFTEAYLASITGSVDLDLTYSAVLNSNCIGATPAITAQGNSSNITYGDAQTSTSSTTSTTTHSFSVFKHASGSTACLAGAVFQLKKGGTAVNLVKIDDYNYRIADANDTNTVTSFTTMADPANGAAGSGKITIWGVDADNDYTLEELTAPNGYNKLTSAENVGTVATDNTTVVNIENNTGAELPSTGGIGTTLFYILGGLLVLGAVVILIVRKRTTD